MEIGNSSDNLNESEQHLYTLEVFAGLSGWLQFAQSAQAP
jgi:hypothetical protein